MLFRNKKNKRSENLHAMPENPTLFNFGHSHGLEIRSKSSKQVQTDEAHFNLNSVQGNAHVTFLANTENSYFLGM